jgi:ribulose-5-phosphate 4-epimerase/fuculose-1-phosphate aldolase
MADVSKAVIDDLKKRLVEGLYVLAQEDVLGAMGHISVRVPGTDTFLINPRYAPNLADVDDICLVTLDGKRLEGPGPIPGELPIHTGILKSRPDVDSVVHCHPRNAVIMGCIDVDVVPFNIVANTFRRGVPVYPEAHQVDTPERGDALALALGDHLAVLQRGHGIAAVGPSIEGCCLVSIRLENSCRDQLEVMKYATPEPVSDQESPDPWVGLKNPYREWPFLMHKHHVRPRDEIKAGIRPPREGTRARDAGLHEQ